MSVPQEPQDQPTEQVRVRRSPKIANFLLAGALLGAVVALVLTFAFPENSEYPPTQVLGFLLVLGIVLGGALGGVVALILDRASQRRIREVGAVREVTVAPPADPAPDAGEPGDSAPGDAASDRAPSDVPPGDVAPDGLPPRA
ncbi:hypothetical protein [Naasia sp. SYSU D00948]|uniref:hypothetical protein n=1 Tax=Naasia sp. SYSU D00948 TaxID=2817379 RepID=UPI001B30F703|nr:hypothetical protein [Naasia sp. SYSU D00948]